MKTLKGTIIYFVFVFGSLTFFRFYLHKTFGWWSFCLGLAFLLLGMEIEHYIESKEFCDLKENGKNNFSSKTSQR